MTETDYFGGLRAQASDLAGSSATVPADPREPQLQHPGVVADDQHDRSVAHLLTTSPRGPRTVAVTASTRTRAAST